MKDITFTSDQFPNCHLRFDAQGVMLQMSLNIDSEMARHLYQGNVHKGKSLLVYSLRTRVNVPTKVNIQSAYDILKCNLMTNCRIAKIKVLENEINRLKN